jgi:2-keto-4-pentenoate hydratase/2-oxohepta-3-ene-1,7-dioic acid hydratase in catechol pathway
LKLLSFAIPDRPFSPRLGAAQGDLVVDLLELRAWAVEAGRVKLPELPASMLELVHGGAPALAHLEELLDAVDGEELSQLLGDDRLSVVYHQDRVIFYPPLVRPMSIRDFYAFEKHVVTANTIRNRQVPEEWYQFPVFYFSNPNSLVGHRQPVPYPSYTQALDYELEVACIIGKQGMNITAVKSEEYIFGYTILNDWSARDIQRQETKVGLGPAKAKDFASSLGPWITTLDELREKATGRPGVYDLGMVARVNGVERSHGSMSEIYYSFGELIERASQEVTLFPGDVIGSGTLGSGSLLELTLGKGPWLQPEDVVQLEVERLGILENRIQPPQKVANTSAARSGENKFNLNVG